MAITLNILQFLSELKDVYGEDIFLDIDLILSKQIDYEQRRN